MSTQKVSNRKVLVGDSNKKTLNNHNIGFSAKIGKTHTRINSNEYLLGLFGAKN